MSSPKIPSYQPPAGGMPAYVPYDISGLNDTAKNFDQQYQWNTANNFAKWNPSLRSAEVQFQRSLPGQVAAGQNAFNMQSNLATGMNSQTPQAMQSISSGMSGIGAGANTISGLSGLEKDLTSGNTAKQVGQLDTNAMNVLSGRDSTPIDPLVQQEMMRSGLSNAAGSLSPESLGTGQVGEETVARNLGISTMDYINQRRSQATQNIQAGGNVISNVSGQIGAGIGLGQAQIGAGQAQVGAGEGVISQAQGLDQSVGNTANQNLGIGEALFPKMGIGLSGSDLANVSMANTAGINNWNQANYASKVQQAQYAANVGAQNAGLQASGQSGLLSAGASAVSAAAIAAFSCGIARAVFGQRTNEWKIFRHWIHNLAPKSVRRTYLRLIPILAPYLEQHASAARLLRVFFRTVTSSTPYTAFA